MKIAGGIVAIIAGLLGICAAIVTLFVGGVGSALESEGAGTVVGLGWGGILFSFLTIIFGAVAIGAKTRKPAIALLVSAVLGAILGGTFVAVCMALALVGGILAAIPKPQAAIATPPLVADAPDATIGPNVQIAPRKSKKILLWTASIGGILLLLIIIAAVGSKNGSSPSGSAEPAAPSTIADKRDDGPITAQVGTTVTTGKFEITVTSVELRNKVGGEYLNSSPSEGGVYVAVQWRYKNISAKPVKSFSFPRLNLMDSDGTKYNSDLGASSYYAGEVGIDRKVFSNLNPGIASTDVEVFEISRESLSLPGWELRIKADKEITIPIEKSQDEQ